MARLKAASKARFDRRNALKRLGRKRRVLFCQTPVGVRFATDQYIEPLAEFLACRRTDGEVPNPMPKGLGRIISQLDPNELAVVTVTPLLNAIYGGWHGDDTLSAEATLRLTIGKYFFDRLAMKRLPNSPDKTARKVGRRLEKGGAVEPSDWRYLKSEASEEEKLRVGHWLLEAATALEYFTLDQKGFPAIAPDWQRAFDDTREQMMLRDPVILPHLSPPPDWTSWRTNYEDRIGATFVRDWRPETKEAISAAFAQPDFAHARGVNHLQQVALKIDPLMIDLAERFAVELMDHNGEQRKKDNLRVINDIAGARALGGKPFWLTYNCDWRGRVYAVPHLWYGREDYVRAMFRFGNGMPLGEDSLRWLEINTANCAGQDKEPFDQRVEWVKQHRKEIEAVAADPFNTVKVWREMDEPFRFVSSCRELVAAWLTPETFVTTLPIPFDGSCNGIQHLALLSFDRDAGARVNLNNCDRPRDLYQDVAQRVKELVARDETSDALAWREAFHKMSAKQIRRLIKRPAMTFAYGATNYKWAQHIEEEYKEIFRGANYVPNPFYLSEKIREAAIGLLPGPAAVMRFIEDLAAGITEHGEVLKWKSNTGFPVANDYRKSNVRPITIRDGQRFTFEIADGALPEIDQASAIRSAAPNFVHSLDAAHLIKVVNRANHEGVANLLTVHDSFACLAPQATHLGKIVRGELFALYTGHRFGYGAHDWYNPIPLMQLGWNSGLPEHFPPGEGELNPEEILDAKYCFH